MSTSTPNDFDFLHGTWAVEHRKLHVRLAGCETWRTLYGSATVRPVLGGIGNIDSFTFDGDAFEGMTLRLFDLAAQVWTIQWADTRRGRLDAPLTGTSEAGVGTFYGRDRHDDTDVLVRFIWRDIGPNEASWDRLSPLTTATHGKLTG